VLVPGTLTVISARLNYLPQGAESMQAASGRLADPGAATVALYAHGRDYHKVMRGKLKALAGAAQAEIGALEAIDILLSEELTLRENSRIKTALRMGRLGTIKTLAGFDFTFQPSLDRDRILGHREHAGASTSCPGGNLFARLDALVQAIIAVSRLAARADVAEAEINPLIIRPAGQGVVVADAWVVPSP
jgi:hypothetical protein